MSRRSYKVSSGGGILPAGYAECEYIESTGTQYIDTGIVAENGFTLECEWMWVNETDRNTYICGSHNTVSPYGRNGIQKSGNGNWGMGIGNSYPASNVKVNNSVWYYIKASTQIGDSYLDIDNERVLVRTDMNSRSSNHLLVFTEQYSIYTRDETSHARCKRLAINSDRVFIPAIRLSDNKPGLYDLCGSICPLTGTPFYINAGSGEFLYKLK